MRRSSGFLALMMVASLVASACSGGDGSGGVLASATTASASSTSTVATTVPPSTTAAAPTTSAPAGSTLPPPPDRAWDQGDLPRMTGVAPVQLSEVALVQRDDVLNARLGAGTGSDVYVGLLPDVVVVRTGAEEVVSGSLWSEIETLVGPLWVNSHFLAAVVSPDDFQTDAAVGQLLEDFASIIVDRGDLGPVISRRGLYVAHHDPPQRFRSPTLDTILTDTSVQYWASTGASAEEIESAGGAGSTFAEAIAESFVGAFSDTDSVLTYNEPVTGGNGRIPEAAIPFEFTAFNYVAVHDPGDDPQFGGLDWTTWYVSVDYENGSPVIIGLTIDEWSP